MVFFSESKKGFEKRIPSERASQEEQNGTSLSFIAPSSEELSAFQRLVIRYGDDLYHVRTFDLSALITPLWKVL